MIHWEAVIQFPLTFRIPQRILIKPCFHSIKYFTWVPAFNKIIEINSNAIVFIVECFQMLLPVEGEKATHCSVKGKILFAIPSIPF